MNRVEKLRHSCLGNIEVPNDEEDEVPFQMSTGQLFYDPIARPLSATGISMPGAYYNFYVSGTSVAATVYQDAALTLPYPSGQLGAAGSSPIFSAIQADGTGAFTPIFLNPQTTTVCSCTSPGGS